MGSFNTAGIVDKGDGYVESCWVKTTNDTPLGSKPNAVFGNPTDTKGYQVVNSSMETLKVMILLFLIIRKPLLLAVPVVRQRLSPTLLSTTANWLTT